MAKVKRAIVSVSDKSGVAEFAAELAKRGVELLSTGGTAKLLREAGLTVTDVSSYTGFPEMLDGRVKTLHPKVHGGILGIRDNPEHVAKMKEYGIEPVDMVVINLYPFEKTVADPNCSVPDAIEQIDIGGPCMVRAAAKNNRFVSVVVDPADYERVLSDMDSLDGEVSDGLRFELATKAYTRTAEYDTAISTWLKGKSV
jgi:phosphoribosylaminoimidazolecarboxamide formyltransferase/IMP cyclohydrolase